MGSPELYSYLDSHSDWIYIGLSTTLAEPSVHTLNISEVHPGDISRKVMLYTLGLGCGYFGGSVHGPYYFGYSFMVFSGAGDIYWHFIPSAVLILYSIAIVQLVATRPPTITFVLLIIWISAMPKLTLGVRLFHGGDVFNTGGLGLGVFYGKRNRK